MKNGFLKKIFVGGIFAVVLMFSVGITTVKAEDMDTTANSAEEAIAITGFGKAQSGDVTLGDSDWYKFTTSKDAFYSIDVKNAAGYGMYYQVYADILCVNPVASGYFPRTGTAYVYLGDLEDNTTYYVRMGSWDNGSEGKYEFTVNQNTDDYQESVFEATTCNLKTAKKAALQDADDIDVFKINTVSEDAYYTLNFKNFSDARPVSIGIYSDDMLVTNVGGTYSYKGETTVYLRMLETNKTYYIVVQGTYKDRNRDYNDGYEFTLNYAKDDVKNTAEEATSLSLNKNVTKYTQDKEDVDIFKFNPDGTNSFYELQMTNASEQRIFYYVYSNKELTSLVTSGIINGQNVNLGKLENKKNTYYIKLCATDTSSEGTINKYSIKVVQTKDDVKDKVSKATNLKLNASNKSYKIQNTTDVDYFKFKTTGFKYHTFSLTNTSSAGVMSYAIYSDKDETKLVRSGYLYPKKSISSEDAKLGLSTKPKTYYIKITSADQVSYKIGVKATAPSSVKLKKTGTKKITVSWKKTSSATGYEIYRATSKNGKYQKIATVKGKVSYTDIKGLKNGKSYYYKIRAYKTVNGSKKYTTYSSIKSLKLK